LRYEFDPTGVPDFPKARAHRDADDSNINGNLLGAADLPVTVPPLTGLGGGLAVCRYSGSPVSRLYGPPFPLTGTIFKVTIFPGAPFMILKRNGTRSPDRRWPGDNPAYGLDADIIAP
jgi:hypothetical protein